jgi:hypothetical protein
MDLPARDIRLHLLVEFYAISVCFHIGKQHLLPLSCPSGCNPAARTEWIHSMFDIWDCQGIPHFVKKGAKMSGILHEDLSTFCWRYQIAIKALFSSEMYSPAQIPE